jgi:hypothetical protein
MSHSPMSGFVTESVEDGASRPSPAELEEARGLFETLQRELNLLLAARTSFRSDLRAAVAAGDELIASFNKA